MEFACDPADTGTPAIAADGHLPSPRLRAEYDFMLLIVAPSRPAPVPPPPLPALHARTAAPIRDHHGITAVAPDAAAAEAPPPCDSQPRRACMAYVIAMVAVVTSGGWLMLRVRRGPVCIRWRWRRWSGCFF